MPFMTTKFRRRASLLDDRHDLVQMLARGELRHDDAETLVRYYLRGDNGRDQPAPVAYDRRRRLGAGAFDAEDEHE
jgi:hypothetical protein